MNSDLNFFFEPRSVAISGSFSEAGGLGSGVIRNLNLFGYRGRIYPVNPSYREIMGLRVYAHMGDLPEIPDVAVVITPPATVPSIVDGYARAGARGAVIISENFAEAGEEGARLQDELVRIRRRTGIRIIGPNTIGLVNTRNGFTTLPHYVAYATVRKGGIAYCSQSGFIAPSAQPLEDRAYPVSKICDIGNKCDVSESELLSYLAWDPYTDVVSMHLEDIRDGRAFLSAARDFSAKKPLLILRSARTGAGARASASHTCSLAGDDQVYAAAFKQAGALRVNTWHEYWELPLVFASQPLPGGSRVAILTLTGGAGVQAADTAVRAGLSLAAFSRATLARLAELGPRLTGNPLDLGPVLSVVDHPFAVQEEAVRAVVLDEGVDCVLVAVYAGFDSLIPVLCEMFERLRPDLGKLTAVWVYGMQLGVIEEMSRKLGALGLPAYIDLETAVKALGFAAAYSRHKTYHANHR